MLGQYAHKLAISTQGRAFYEITNKVNDHVNIAGYQTGLVTLHVLHTSASLLIQENADPSVQTDFESIFSRLAPDGDPVYAHNYEGDDDMAAHIRTALTNVNISIPISKGSIVLGTWQGIYLWEHRTHPHNRHIHLHILGQ